LENINRLFYSYVLVRVLIQGIRHLAVNIGLFEAAVTPINNKIDHPTNSENVASKTLKQLIVVEVEILINHVWHVASFLPMSPSQKAVRRRAARRRRGRDQAHYKLTVLTP
jgi:hypothetical protein